MRERKNSLAMGLGVHGGRRVRDLVGWRLRTERESQRWLAGWQWIEEREVLTPNHRDGHFFFFSNLI